MTSTSEPSISFVVCTRNRKETVLACVAQLLSSERTDIEVIVRDNCSEDGTASGLAQIADERLHVQVAPENQGTLTFFLSAKEARGKIVTWLSDEDAVDFAELANVLRIFDGSPSCDVVMGSITVGRQGTRVQYPDVLMNSPAHAFVDAVSFSGCGGVFVRRDALRERVHEALAVKTPDDAYRLWNYYPIGFFASRCVSAVLVKTSAIVVRQVRFAQTTNNWSRISARHGRVPHYYPDSVADRLASNMVGLWHKRISLWHRTAALVRMLRMFRGQVSGFSSLATRQLLLENYSPDIVQAYEAELRRHGLGTALGRLLWLMRVTLSLPMRCRNVAMSWKARS